MDIINCAHFYHNQLRGLDSVEMEFYHSHRNAMSPLILLELTFRCDVCIAAFSIVLYYVALCVIIACL